MYSTYATYEASAKTSFSVAIVFSKIFDVTYVNSCACANVILIPNILFIKMAASTDLFINLIQNHPIVYDKSLKDFKNIRKKDDAWEDIAHQSRMDGKDVIIEYAKKNEKPNLITCLVEAAKKRYFSLRQKYCREKRNIEVKRRNKIVYRNTWVFYDRLQFLDAFIQPRSYVFFSTIFPLIASHVIEF